MLLSDVDLWRALHTQDIAIKPMSPVQVQPASVDLRLGEWFRHFRRPWRPESWPVDPYIGNTYKEISELVQADRFVIEPQEFILCSTLEKVTLGPRHAARLEGRSSIGRLGISVHVTAGFIDPGFNGHITMEVVNFLNRPVVLHAGMPICQLAVHLLLHATEKGYDGSYQDQGAAPEPSRYWCKYGSEDGSPSGHDGSHELPTARRTDHQ